MNQGRKIVQKKMKKKALAAVFAAGLLAVAPVAMPRAEAFGWMDVFTGVINTAVEADAIRSNYLNAGDNPVVQNTSNTMAERQATANRSVDSRAVTLIDGIMKQLVDNGDYVLRNNSLPFRWKVVANDEFNASCNCADFVTVYDGIVDKCGYNRDMLAAVLGHEMTHGFNQHIANSVAKTAWAKSVSSMASAALNSSNFGVGTSLSDLSETTIRFLSVKNINLPDEKDADRNGFFVMASAGFNPGGAAAMMARMSYYTEHHSQVADFFNPDDHPDTRKRLKDMAELLHNYGIGHTEVKNVNDIYFDKELLLTAEPDGMQDAEEMAYLISGGIAKGFHDNRFFTSWNFKTLPDGSVDFLTNDPVYVPLKNALKNEKGLGQRFQAMVERAYGNDVKNNVRVTYMKEELERKQKNRELREKQANRKEDSGDKAVNGRTYLKLGLTDLAEKEFQRSAKLDANNPSAKSGLATVMGKQGKFDAALQLANEAIAMDPNLGSSYVARAIIYKDMGNLDSALNDCNKALQSPAANTYAYKLAGDIFHAQGAEDSALMEYRAYHEARPGAKDIPAEYAAGLQ